jgi:CBS domain-containing protein
MLAKDIMTKDVKTLKADGSIEGAVELFAKNGISGAPVVDDENHIVGILTDVDIMKSLRVRYPKLSMVFPSSHALGVSFTETIEYRELIEAISEICHTKISEIMNPDVITVLPETNVGELIHILVTKKINRLPVIKDGVVVGIISRMDVTRKLSGIVKEQGEKQHRKH